jgi:hypothetical protein
VGLCHIVFRKWLIELARQLRILVGRPWLPLIGEVLLSGFLVG